MPQFSPDDTFRQGLWRLVDDGTALLKRQGLLYSQQFPPLEQVKTVEEATKAATLAAVKVLTAVVGPLSDPRHTPTLEQGEQALQALRQHLRVTDAYSETLHQTVTAFCLRLEAELDAEAQRAEDHLPPDANT
jgi:hypothetical protein